MSLLSIHLNHPSELYGYRAEQIVALAGDGRLRDGTTCSNEFRHYLANVGLERLSSHIQETLTQKFQDSGFVLQDLVNEIGRRLGFTVENGRYHGVVNQSGHDGFWHCNDMSLVVEVKTTDAYRINLNTLASYAIQKAPPDSDTKKRFGILIVVGRQDTGDLEAQIRGSKHAWDIRVISVESLIELSRLCEVSVDDATSGALRNSLLPVEYTRVDHLVSLLSRLAFDVERSTAAEIDNSAMESAPLDYVKKNEIIKESIESLRGKIVASLGDPAKVKLRQHTTSRFESADGTIYLISLSKRYDRTDQKYWYAFQSKWIPYLDKENSYLCIGMLDHNYYFQIPGLIATKFPQNLNKTEKKGVLYWHMGLIEENAKTLLLLPKIGSQVELEEYKVFF
jgi:hypothetical protein